MVKRRPPKTNSQATPEAVEAFAAAAETVAQPLDPNAKRDFKQIRVVFNEYEFRELEQLAQKTGRSRLNTIRWAIHQLAQQGHQK